MNPDWEMMGFIPVRDAAEARRFYENALRMRFVSQDGFATVMEANGVMIRLVHMGAKFTPVPYTILGWRVPEITCAVGALAEAGVSLESFGLPGQDETGIWTAPGGSRIAWFRDPDGNTLSLSEHH